MQKVSPGLGVILLDAGGSVEDTRLGVQLFGVHTPLSLGELADTCLPRLQVLSRPWISTHHHTWGSRQTPLLRMQTSAASAQVTRGALAALKCRHKSWVVCFS